jgi:hypothetical protein
VVQIGRPCSEVIDNLEGISYRMYTFIRAIRVFLNNPSKDNERIVSELAKDLRKILGEYRTGYERLASSAEDTHST